jgi:hypothetical protein
MDNEANCPACDAPITSSSDAYCTNCGQTLPAAAPTNAVPTPQGRSAGRPMLITGAGLLVASVIALVLPMPWFGDMSVWAAQDLCSIFGAFATEGECIPVNIIWLAALIGLGLGLVLIGVGLTRRPAQPVDAVVSSSTRPSATQALAASVTAAAATRAPLAAKITRPTSAQTWMIGLGAAVGVVSFVLPWSALGADYTDAWGLASLINLLAAIALLAVAAGVFAADRVPQFAHARLATLVVVVAGLGMGLNQVTSQTTAFGASIFLVAMLIASIGAISLEVSIGQTPNQT